MTLMRNALLGHLLEDLSRLEQHMAELHSQSRNWAQDSRATQALRLVEKDFRMFEARMKVVLTEIEHLEAKNRQFTGEGVESRQPPK